MNLDLFKNNQNLHQATADLFKEQLKIAINLLPEKAFSVSQYFGENVKDLNIITNIYTVGIVNQDSFSNSESLNDDSKVKIGYDTIFLVAIELEKPQNRSNLAQLTRKLNQKANKNEKGNPLIVVFRYEDKITISSLERQARSEKDWREGQKISNTKVSMLKDIEIENPHRAHKDILKDLGEHNANNYETLYQYWQKVLNTKKLNNDFYDDLFKWYLWAKDNVVFPNGNNEEIDKYQSESLIRFISRLLFVWFMKEKKLIDEQLFKKESLSNILKNFDSSSKKNIYYRAILQNLFFASLNVPIEDRKWIDGKKGNKAQIGDPLIYRYEKEFVNSDDVIENIFMNIPFLNGGLFDCLDIRYPNNPKDDIFIDGFTKNEAKQPYFPNFLFFGEHNDIDLSHHFGGNNDEVKKWKRKNVTGIIDLLNNYKFTVEENTPLEIDVALDPELLGKVFENLLASYNPETKASARKQTGSFYTPREIVNYMVDESLKQHLKTHLPNYENEIEALFKKELLTISNSLKKDIVKKLFDCKILDPACGSGAYPMGILHKMVELMTVLDPNNESLKQIMKDKLIGEKIEELNKDKISIEGLSDSQVKQKALEAVEERLLSLERIFNNEYIFDDYARKLYIIENCIYGVDIQPIAIQISKLRFFISLLVEQNKKEDHPNFGIEPLPNMDFKLVAANTLIAPPQEDKGIGLFTDQDPFFDDYEQLAHDYFTLHTPDKKRDKKEELKKLIQEKVSEKVQMIRRDEEAHTFNGVAKNKKSELALANLHQSKSLWESYQNLFKEQAVGFFETPYFFPKVKDGFDVVIGNPPYVEISDKNEKLFYQNNYKDFLSGHYDLYIFFFKKGIDLLKNNGILVYITPHTFLHYSQFKNLRQNLFNNRIIKISNKISNVFENAVVDTSVSIIQKTKQTNYYIDFISAFENENKNISFKVIDQISKEDLNSDSFDLTAIKKLNELKLYSENTNLLGDITESSQGITVFAKVQGEKINYFRDSFTNEENLKPFFKGRDFSKYIMNENLEQYIIYGSHLWCSRDDKFFENPKLFLRQTSDKIIATYIEKPYYAIDSVHSIISFNKNYDLKYILSILNSKFGNYLYQLLINEDGKVFAQVKLTFLRKIPIKTIPESAQQPFITLVNQILEGKKTAQDTSHLEHQIDVMVYHLYGLSYEEACVIDAELSKEDYEEYKL